jgi:hypothetical protein
VKNSHDSTYYRCVRKLSPSSKEPPDAKTVWIFTNEADPCRGSEDEQRLLIRAAEDAAENGLDFHVWKLPKAGNEKGTWGDSVFTQFASNVDFLKEEMDFDMEDMMYRVQQQGKKARKSLTFPLLLPDWRENPDCPGILVDAFRTVQVTKRPTPIIVSQRTNM